jgi:hypothetical protein
MPGPSGGANLLWTTIRGSESDLQTVREPLKNIGAFIEDVQEDGQEAIRAYYRDDLDVQAIGRILNEIDRGKFGKIKTKDFLMGLDTLPADKCIRHTM